MHHNSCQWNWGGIFYPASGIQQPVKEGSSWIMQREYLAKDLSKQYWSLLDGTKNSVF